jgi:hypothetical protein
LILNLITWVLASDTDSVLVEAAHAFLYLSIVALTLQTIQAIVELFGYIYLEINIVVIYK